MPYTAATCVEPWSYCIFDKADIALIEKGYLFFKE